MSHYEAGLNCPGPRRQTRPGSSKEVAIIESYDAVIIGSAVYTGHWLAPAKDLVYRYLDVLASRPVWLFSSGPVGDPSGKLSQAMRKDPVDVAALSTATHARAMSCLLESTTRKR